MGKMKISGRNFFCCLYYCLTAAGVIYQTSLIIEMYLQYKVSSKIKIAFPASITPAAISVCTRFTDVLDFQRLNQESNRNWKNSIKESKKNWSYSIEADIVRKYQHELTIEEIFKFTPREHEIINRIVFKKTSGSLTITESEDPYQYLDVSKYIYVEFICYMISLKERESWTFESFAVTPVGSGLIYRIDFASNLTRTRFLMFAFTHDPQDYPARSIMFSTVYRRDILHTMVDNDYTGYHYRLFAKTLEYPYETDCFDYNKIDPKVDHDVDCAQLCMYQKTVKRFNKFPYSIIIDNVNNASSLKMISYIDMLDEKIASQILSIKNDCKQNCRWTACLDSRTVAVTDSKHGRQLSSDSFHMSYILSTHPNIYIYASPHVSFVEFITYIISTISTWTGLSIMAMNPLEFAIRIWRRFKINNRRKQRLQRKAGRSVEEVRTFMTSVAMRLRKMEMLLDNRQTT